MRYENLSHEQSVKLEQARWYALRRNGLRSLTVAHQNVDVPQKWSRTLEELIIEALPVTEITRAHIRNNHQPLLMGWALGTDHRKRSLDHRSTYWQVRTDADIPRHHANDYHHGMNWTNEMLTGRAAQESVQTIINRKSASLRAFVLQKLLDTKFTETNIDLPKQVEEFRALLDDPDIRYPLLDSWFSGDFRRAQSQIRRFTGFDLPTFTVRLGRSGSYLDISEKQSAGMETDGAEYANNTGIASLHTPILKRLPILLGLDAAFLMIHPQRWYTLIGALLGTVYTGYFVRYMYPFPVTALAHETTHALAEGNGHMGWFPVRYIRRINDAKKYRS